MNKIFVIYPNTTYTCGCVLVAAKTRQEAINTLTLAVTENSYYKDYFTLPSEDYTEEWENSSNNILNIKFIEKLEQAYTDRTGVLKTCLWDRNSNTEYAFQEL